MRLVIVDTEKDKEYIKKEYPYPMLLKEESSNYIVVLNGVLEEKIFKKDILKINKITISDKLFKQVK